MSMCVCVVYMTTFRFMLMGTPHSILDFKIKSMVFKNSVGIIPF